MRKTLNKPQVEEVANDLPLHLKYRPSTFKEVIGQDAVVKSLKAALDAKSRPHVFLFTGGPGTGKTTLSRIMATELRVSPENVMEIDAATNNGIDVMRDIMAPLRYKGFGESPNKAVILDEAHMLSKQAWASLLKTVEEPPTHVFFFFCTTESGKVPEAIVTRCLAYNLRPVGFDDLADLIDDVVKQEDLDVSDEVRRLVAGSANGSPRQALVMLAQVQGCSREEAVRVLETPVDNAEVITLCRELVAGKLTWESATATIKGLGDMPAESIRIIIVAYLTACLMGSKTEKSTVRLLDLLECFSKPYPATDKMAPLLRSIGAWLYN